MRIEFELPGIPDQLKNVKITIGHLLLLSLVLRVFIMGFPSDGGKIFDEAHYTNAVEAILLGEHANPEHPPLTKLIVAAFVKVFGNHWFSWRLPMVIFSTISTYLVYLIAKHVFPEEDNETVALFAVAVIIFDLIWFIHGNIFMLEPPAMAFGLAFILFYLKGRWGWSGLFFSLSCLANEKALFFMFGVGTYHLLTQKIKFDRKLITFVGVFLLVGVGGLGLFDYMMPPSKGAKVTHIVNTVIAQTPEGVPVSTETRTEVTTEGIPIGDPVSHALWMLEYYSTINSNLDTGINNFRPPWSWITPFGANPFNSAQYLVSSVSFGDKSYKPLNYRAQTPIPIWYMTIPIVALALYLRDDVSKFLLSGIAGSYLPWLIKDIIQQNMTFNHYFQFTIPFICMGIPWFWKNVSPKHWKSITLLHVLVCAVFFLWFFPVGVIKTF